MAINATLPPALEPLAAVITSIMDVTKILVGGIFGLYLILLIAKWIEYKRLVRLLIDIKNQLYHLNEKFDKKSRKKKR